MKLKQHIFGFMAMLAMITVTNQPLSAAGGTYTPIVHDSLSFQAPIIQVGPFSFNAAYTLNGPDSTHVLVTAQGQIVNDGIPPSDDACEPLPPNSLPGKIGIVIRSGNCGSGRMVLNTEAGGAEATLIITNDDVEVPYWNFGGSANQTKPAVAISHYDGSVLLDYLSKNPTAPITILPPPKTTSSSPAAINPLLLTDGSVMVINHDSNPYNGQIWRFTPDIFGNYVNGTWSQLDPLPVIGGAQYLPLYNASAVLPDGRVVFMGGEYAGQSGQNVLTNKCAIYDPVENFWTEFDSPKCENIFPAWNASNGFNPVPLYDPNPNGYGPIGDSSTVILENGSLLLQPKLSYQGFILDAKTLTWRQTRSLASKYPQWNSEESLTLLPNGKVLAVNLYAREFYGFAPYPPNPSSSQIYNPKTEKWRFGGSTINSLVEEEKEIGVQILRPDGNVFVSGVNEKTSIYNYKTKTWSEGPSFPFVDVPTPSLIISGPPGAAGTYVPPTIGFYGCDPQGNCLTNAFSISGNIVQTNPPIISEGPYDPLPPNSIALIGVAACDYPDCQPAGSPLDYFATLAADAAGAIGVIFYDRDGSVGAAGFYSDGVIPSFGADYELGQLLLKNLDGLKGTLEQDLVPGPLQMADNRGCLLPNGNLWLNATTGPISNIFEFDGTNLIDQGDSPLSNPYPLSLPSGELFLSDSFGYHQNILLYTPENPAPNPCWAPTITSCPKKVKPGKTYKIEGYLFNGMSQTNDGSDDFQAATNYPLVRITNKATGHVFYCRTHDHSFMGVAAKNKKVHTYFDVPKEWVGYEMELGASKIEVVANGIPSEAHSINVTNKSAHKKGHNSGRDKKLKSRIIKS